MKMNRSVLITGLNALFAEIMSLAYFFFGFYTTINVLSV